jgi:hypothetical protein
MGAAVAGPDWAWPDLAGQAAGGPGANSSEGNLAAPYKHGKPAADRRSGTFRRACAGAQPAAARSKLRSVFRPQKGHCQPMSSREPSRRVREAGATSTFPRWLARPARTRPSGETSATRLAWHSQRLRSTLVSILRSQPYRPSSNRSRETDASRRHCPFCSSNGRAPLLSAGPSS